MYSVGISIKPSDEALRLGYDEHQINRITIRIAQFFLNKNMRIVFGHDWRNDGVMRAVADFAQKVEPAARTSSSKEQEPVGINPPIERMLNIVAESRNSLTRDALKAERDSGGILKVMTATEAALGAEESVRSKVRASCVEIMDSHLCKLTELRHYLTAQLKPGCRICLGGQSTEEERREPGVVAEARLALEYEKPLYLMGGFGGASRLFGNQEANYGISYWESRNGLINEEKNQLFQTTDIELGVHLIERGIRRMST